MDHADDFVILVDDRQDRNRTGLVLFHDVQGFRSQLMVGNDPRVLGHHGIDRPLEEVGPCFQAAADVAVGDQADEFTVFIYDGYGTQALFGHEEEGILDDAVFADDRVVLAFMHDIVDSEQEFLAQGSAGMEDAELFLGEMVLRQEDDSQGIA